MFHVLLFCRGCSFLRNSQTPGNFFKKSDESTFKCFEFILSLQLCILCRMLNRLPSRLEEIDQLGSKNLFCTQLYAFLLIIKLTKYFSETDLIDQGLIIELWNKGVLWVIFCSFAKINFAHKWIVANILLIQDKLLGVYYLDLKTVPYSQSHVKWLQINEEFETRLGIKWN